MPNQSTIEKLKKELPELFKEFSAEFLEFVFSEQTASQIAEICLENGVKDEKTLEKIGYRAVLVLLDQIPKENFAGVLKNGAGLDLNTAQKIAGQINEVVFSQAPPSSPGLPRTDKKISPQTPSQAESQTEPLAKKPQKKDPYRESLE